MTGAARSMLGTIMRRYLCLFVVLLAFTSVACPPAPSPPVVDPHKKDDAKFLPKVPATVENVEQLKPRLELALDVVRSHDLLTTHGFWTVFHGILGTGPEKTMLKDPKTKQKVNAIDYICNGGELPGLAFLPTKYGLDVEIDPRKQFLGQGHQDQFIAEMAEWGMPRDRKFKVGGKDFTFEDFIHHSMMRASVKKDQELSWAIIIIGQFYGTNHQWTNSFDERLRYEDVVRYELDQSIEKAACGGTHRLFGLTWAYHLHLKRGGKKEGVWLDVEKKVADYKQRAKEMQQRDGTFSTKYFEDPEAPNPHPNTELYISTSGHILEWLALAMTDDELRSPWMQKAVNAVVLKILDMGRTPVDGGALYHAGHGLYLYHERVFGTPAAYLPLLGR
jgi:hypothetical protein